MALRSITRPNTASAETTTAYLQCQHSGRQLRHKPRLLSSALTARAARPGGCREWLHAAIPSQAAGHPIAAHQISLTLAPGESRSLIFVLGYAENPKEEKWEKPGIINKTPARELLARFRTDAQVDAAFAKLNEYWNTLLAKYAVDSADEKVNRMVNIWNQYQCMVTFNMSRSASYYESGTGRGMGFRDSCQDLLGFVHLIPERARGTYH